ncbi:hypothetical protein [Streptomyces sp. NPDC056154]|uniref:hypothetical protein n=1 Tax=unclassified Streptomyces TaxID=2593676 RepID=UPI0035DDD3F5
MLRPPARLARCSCWGRPPTPSPTPGPPPPLASCRPPSRPRAGTGSPTPGTSPRPGRRAGRARGRHHGDAAEHHLPDITLAALRFARANDRTFPKPVDKRGAELLYRVGDLKKWARNRPRAATGTTDLD